jgi:hypothetical protein
MQNKANFRKSQMNVSKVLTMDYEKMGTWLSGKNKAKTNPIQTQFKANTNPIQTQFKPNTKSNKANFGGKKMLPKAQPGGIVEAACCLKYYIAERLLEREQL